MSEENEDLTLKILLVGDSGVGKTNLVYRFTDRKFEKTFISTIACDLKFRTISLSDKNIKLQVWDITGQERFGTVTKGYYPGTNGIMIVFDVKNRESFENISKWLTNIQEFGSNEITKLLVGNKADNDKLRSVSQEEAKQLAEKLQIEYIETSALNNENVDKAFENLVKKIIKLN